MCGEMAGNIEYTRMLLGMGLRDFSMDPSMILAVKRQIRLTDIVKISPKIDLLFNTTDQDMIRRIIDEINQ